MEVLQELVESLVRCENAMSIVECQSYVAGRFSSTTDGIFESVNPASGDVVARCATCGDDHVNEALAAAGQAALELEKKTGVEIAGFLARISQEILELGTELIEVAGLETGLPVARLEGERGRTCGQIAQFAELLRDGSWCEATIDTAIVDREPVAKPDIRALFVPVGPVVVFGASNFPFAFGTAGGDTVSALAAGNPVIVKAHPSHPATNALFARALDRAVAAVGFPAGTISVLQGVGNRLGEMLVEHPLTKAVGFTGSLRGGRALMDIAARRAEPIPVFAEMGSVNPVFVLPDALKNRGAGIAAGMAQSLAMGGGQFCTSPGLLITLRDEGFASALAAQVAAAPTGVMLNHAMADTLCREVLALEKNPRVELMTGGSNPVSPITPNNSLFRIAATTLLESPELQEEMFGPVAILVECDDEAQLLIVAEALNGNLTASIHGDGFETELAQGLVHRLSRIVGRVVLNGFPTGVEVCPAMHHGGPYPASSAPATSSVGTSAITRFVRRVAFQDCPDELLPAALQQANPLQILRQVNGHFTTAAVVAP